MTGASSEFKIEHKSENFPLPWVNKMAEIHIRLLEKDEHELWDELVDISPQGTLFHKLDWLKTVEKHTNSKLYLFIGYRGNEIMSAIPFFYHRKFIFKRLSSPIDSAMIQNLGPIFPYYDKLKQNKKEFYFREFQKELHNYIYTKINPQKLTIVTSPNLIDVRPYIWLDYQVIPKYNYKKNVEDLDSVWKAFKNELRKNIRKTEKRGVEVIEGDLTIYKQIIQSLSKRLKEQELNLPVSERYMVDLYRLYPTNLKIMTAEYEGEQASGIIFFTYKDRVTIWAGATRSSLKGLYPVDLLQWRIIEFANRNGFKYCEILGANMPTISYFKSRYNFDLDIYYYVKK